VPAGVEALWRAGRRYFAAAHPLRAAKALRQCQAQALWPARPDLELAGFELHRGLSQVLEPSMENGPASKGHGCRPLASAADLGCWQPAPAWVVAAPTCMGCLKSGPWRRRG